MLCEISRTENRKPDGEGLRSIGGGVECFSIADSGKILRRKVGHSFIVSFLKVVDLEGPTERVGHFDISCLIEKNVIRSNIAQPFPYCCCLSPRLGQAEQEKPHLSFCELSLEAFAVVYLFDEQIGIIFIGNLHVGMCTCSMPVFPQSPALEKSCDFGRSKFVVLALWYFSRFFFHRSYSFSSTDCEVCSSFWPSRETILDLVRRGWLI